MATITVFVQVEGERRVRDIALNADVTEQGLCEALAAAGIPLDSAAQVFINEAEEAIVGDGRDHPRGLGDGARVHVARCHRILTTVHYLDKTLERAFAPGARVKAVKTWAVKELALDHKDAHEHVLELCGTTERPAADTALHTLLKAPGCTLCFNLVPEKRVEG